MLVDTHCHIHELDYSLPIEGVYTNAREASVEQVICVGTSVESTRHAIEFAQQYPWARASIGVHPHDTKDGYNIAEYAKDTGVVAVGEIGLDYYYNHSPKETQIKALREQIQVALDHNLPIIFHVRDAFDDFWPIFDSFEGIRGVLHSFTDSRKNMEKAIEKGLFIGVNGISTFTKDPAQQAMFDAIPLDKLLLETDAPFLTPSPFRGKINEPALVRTVAEHIANRRGLSTDEIATQTTANARALFAL